MRSASEREGVPVIHQALLECGCMVSSLAELHEREALAEELGVQLGTDVDLGDSCGELQPRRLRG